MPNVSFDCISTSVRCNVNGAGVARLSRKLAFKSAVGVTSAAARFLIDVGRRGGRVLSRSVQPLLADQIERPSTPASPQHRSENAETPYKVSKHERPPLRRVPAAPLRPSIHQANGFNGVAAYGPSSAGWRSWR